MRERRREAQPSGIKTFGSTFKNPEDPRAEGRTAGRLLEDAGCRGLRVGGARFSEKHANFVENEGEATTADVLALMAEGRRRVHERFGIVLEPEVQQLGELRWPRGVGAVRRRVAAGVLALAVVVAAYLFLFSGSSVAPNLIVALPTSVIGSGEDAVGVSARGQLLAEGTAPEDGTLPRLPLSEAAEERPSRRHDARAGPGARRRAGADPRPASKAASYGESGVDVMLRSGIELRFGDATRADAEVAARRRRCWPIRSITALDYVDLHSPGRPAVSGLGPHAPVRGRRFGLLLRRLSRPGTNTAQQSG